MPLIQWWTNLNKWTKGLIVFIIVMIIVGLLLELFVKPELFGDVMGARGEFRNQYLTCLNLCEKTDPTERASQNPWACGLYCDDVVSQSVAAGKQLGHLVSVEDFCEKQCQGATDNLDCQARCGCYLNTQEMCKQKCKYRSPSESPEGCMSSCLSLGLMDYCINGNSWTWRPI